MLQEIREQRVLPDFTGHMQVTVGFINYAPDSAYMRPLSKQNAERKKNG